VITFLHGELYRAAEDHLVLEVGGVGYRLLASTRTLARLPQPGEKVHLWTHLQVREDAWILYGFKELEERAMFEQLLTIAGIGPKSALAVLSALPVAQLREALGRGDVALLTSLPGIGKKTARRLILELGEKVGEVPGSSGTAGGAGQAVEALVSLGYSRSEALWAVEEAAREGSEDASAVLRSSLRRLAGR
jgi:Holliday junction DNA helicase RuvA